MPPMTLLLTAFLRGQYQRLQLCMGSNWLEIVQYAIGILVSTFSSVEIPPAFFEMIQQPKAIRKCRLTAASSRMVYVETRFSDTLLALYEQSSY